MIVAFKRLAGIANSRFHLGFDSAFLASKRLAGIANSHVHLGFYIDIYFEALSWYSEFAFSPRILY